MKNVILAQDMNQDILNTVAKNMKVENLEEGEEFMVLQTVAIVGVRKQGQLVVQKLLPNVI